MSRERNCWAVLRTCLLCLSFPLVQLPHNLCQVSQGPVPGSSFCFTQSFYSATISENSAARTYLTSDVRMGIALKVRSWEIAYGVAAGDDKGLFEVEDYTMGDFCFLRIRTRGGSSEILNREVKDVFVLTVRATSADGLEASAVVNVKVLDTNDLRPLFAPTTYSVTVPESAPLGASVARVTATDADAGSNGELYYFFKEKTEVFAIHPTSGVVFLTARVSTDDRVTHELEVLAIDRGMKLYGDEDSSSMAKLFVHVVRINEYPPTLTVITRIPSWHEKDPVLADIAVDDLDDGLNGEIEWVSIVAGDPLELFSLDRLTGGKEYRIAASELGDLDQYPYGCNLTLQAKDRGSPAKLSELYVVPLSFQKPQPILMRFEKDVYEVTLNEISPPGSFVETLKISPEPNGATYTLSPTPDSTYFKITTSTGMITTARLLTLVNQEVFQLEVVEVETMLRTKVRVVILDANDNTPVFTQPSYRGTVNESSPTGTVVLTVSAVDDDKGENSCITYSISSLQLLPFTMDQSTGELKVSKELDFESLPDIYTFVVRASDWGSPFRRESEVNVIVHLQNINDNQPMFERIDCRGVMPRDFPVGQPIITMSAIDIDEPESITYNILSGNDQDFFNLNPDSGILSLRRSLVTATPRNGVFTLEIVASDGERVSEPTFVNISVVHGRMSSKSLNCKETRVAQKLVEKLLKKTRANSRPRAEQEFTDLFSVNRLNPQFESLPSEIRVREDLAVGTSVYRVRAYDGDPGFNGKVLFAISDGNKDSCFRIDMESGLITVFLPMDREKMDRYVLNLSIYDMGFPQKVTWRLLAVNLEDANDNVPQFVQDGYSTVISENAAIGTEVVRVKATDRDLGQNGQIYYTLLTGTAQFAINRTTGVINVAGKLDRESIPTFYLKVEARDGAEMDIQKFSVTTVIVSVEDVNDCPPAFIPKCYNVRVPEDLPVGTIIAWLEAQDPDLGPGGQVRYSLADDYNGKFEVHRESGTVRMTGELDYETRQFYNLTVLANDCGQPISLRSVSFVEVEVVDVNENLYAPYFTDFTLRGFVKENTRVGTSMLRVVAQDDDKGRDGTVRYSVRGGSGLGRFSIDEETGIIYTSDTLDREMEDSYWLTVYATDRGVVPLYSTVEVYIQVEDVNDNAPLTSEPVYHPSVMENSPKDVHVLQVHAQDLDATATSDCLSYRISSGNPQNFFTINSKTGLITTTSRKLDREQQDEHFLEVTVSDGGQSPRQSTVWVMVHVLDENDNEPWFPEKLYQIKLPERGRSKRGDPVYRVFACDRDVGPNANLSYSIVNGNEGGRFFIDPQTAVVSWSSRRMSTAGSFDLLTIRATDGGNPPMSSTAELLIEWIQKPAPSLLPLLFSEPYYNFTIAESSPVAAVVGVVSTKQSATPLWFDVTGDKQAWEVFYIPQVACSTNCSTGGGHSSQFDIKKGVGTIVLAAPLDAELQSLYSVTVTVTDGSTTASTQVFIKVLDANDNTPTFSQPTYFIAVSEDTPADTEVFRAQAADPDERSKLSYSIHSSVDPASMRLFRIIPGTGALYTADRLDYESQTQHILTIMVKDQELPYRRDLARILVAVEDANDHAPYFTHSVYEGAVFEAAAVGTVVLKVTALDRDKEKNGELLYSVEAGNIGNTFSMDPTTGAISLTRQLDLASVGQYVLTVRATDNGSPPMGAVATVCVFVTLSENSKPKFLQKEYQAEVKENMAVGTFVTVISAASRSALTFGLKQGDDQGRFRINRFTGVITTCEPLDYESATSYVLTVEAYNMAGIASSVTVNIHVVDENDNAPVFQRLQYAGSISEAAPINSVIISADNGTPLVLRTTDADNHQNALLMYQIVDNVAQTFFTVDSGTGSLRTIGNLDYEICSEFFFSVQVRDTGQPQLTAESFAQVTVRVLNINDSPPRFSLDSYETVLLLPTCAGAEVLQVSASDPDLSVPAGLTYTLVDRSLEHFILDPESGVLMVKNSNFSQDRYRFSVEVFDGKFRSTALVTVMVREAMDGGLIFLQQQYSCSVQENSDNVTTVAVVNAVGNRLNEPVRYSLLNSGKRFRIKSTSGVIQTTGIQFDREEKDVYELVVEASREQNRLRVARATVRVQVEDVNDNPPMFVGLPYYAAVQVDAEPGSPVFWVSAIDQDKGVNGQVSYFLKEEHEYFDVNRFTGEFTLKKSLDVDLSNLEFRVVVFAKDGGDPPLLTAVEFPITVVNKAMPVFEKSFYGISVNEDIAVHTPILSINAASPAGEKVIYTIVDGDPSSQFNIGFDTGVISVLYLLDYESNPYYRLTVRATDTFSGARAEVDVDIAVLDVNDNPPEFEKTSYKAALSETSMTGTPALQVVATDKDSEKNNNVRYQILSEVYGSTDYFHIDSSSGLIFTGRFLDYELMQQCNFIVRATDNGFPMLSSEVLVTVTIEDTNDNPPMFTKQLYEAHVSELAPKGHFVTCVQALDMDKLDAEQLRYSILSGNERANFALDEETGIISLSSQRKEGMQQLYILNVSVSDGIFTSTAQVHIHILEANLYSPVFSQRFYLAQIRENSPVGSKVIQLRATDEDSGIYGQLTYCFVNDLGKDQFSIDSSGQILTAGKLDRENPSNKDIVLTVMASDRGGRACFCSVRVMLTDENDNSPRFKATEYRASVKSSVNKGFPVTQIQAIDQDDSINGKVTYSLYSEARVPVVDILEIDPDNGWIITKGSFSHLKNTVLSFFAKAADGGTPMKHSLVSVYVHVLPPDAPILSFTQPQYSFTVPEDTPVGTALGSVHLAASQTAFFSLTGGETADSNRGGVFMVERETGVIRLVKPLDHEAIEVFRFKVLAATKPSLLESVSVVDVEVKVLDLNDNAPSFETGSYEAVVMEGMPVGTRVIQVRALDPDWGSNGQVTYYLHSPAKPEIEQFLAEFTIDSKTGWITTLRELDYEMCPSFTFTVVAADLGEIISRSSTTVVTVTVADVNDNSPSFEKSYYRGAVMESDPPGEVVAVLSTKDKDGADMNRRVTFHITGGNNRSAFGLGLVQGEWKVYVGRQLDREEQDLYLINITATDGLFVTQAVVEVTVMDSNDNSPVCDQALYSTSFPEGIPLSRVVLTVGATDADAGPNAEIQYTLFGIGVEDFYMDGNTGDLKTASDIDRERTASYKLIAQATDGGGLFCRSKILLTILDMNDNPPVFLSKRYMASIYENASPKALLTRVQAYDPDEGINQKIGYSLVDSADGIFSIDESMGIVVLEKNLDRELQASYSVTVQATDGALSSMTDLDITVLDVNDNLPVFQGRDYVARVPEDIPVGTQVLRVYATSADIGSNAEIYYTFRAGNELEKFQIALATGTISVSEALDYEICKDYFLVVEAWDGGVPPLSAVTTVTISVTDVNDNPPRFSKDLYNVVVAEDARIGQSVLRLQAEDMDGELNGQVTYFIVNGDDGNCFSVESDTGLMRVNKQLDRETVSSYSLIVHALDSGSPVLSSTATVDVEVSDVNDNPPLISPNNTSIAVQYSKPLGSNILQISVTDSDAPLNGPPFEFRIISGNEGDAFAMDQEGALRTNQYFGRHLVREYSIQVQVTDSGRPPLSSTAFIFVRITGDNLFRPDAFPLEIYVIIAGEEFPGGIVGRIHATDRDEDDVLSFSQKFQQKSLFKINRQDGRIVALAGLRPGRYLLNATVSDGGYAISVDVSVVVERATAWALRDAVAVRLEGVAPEDFVLLHLRDFKSALLGLAGTATQDPCHILSIQPVPGSYGRLDVLLAVESATGAFMEAEQLAWKIRAFREQLEGSLRISAILEQGCPKLQCGEQWCEQRLLLEPNALVSYSTPRTSFVSPRFSCSCPPQGGSCPAVPKHCQAQPCPGDMLCVDAEEAKVPYTCQCPAAKLGECAGQSSLTFTGNSYIKYRVFEKSKTGAFKLGLRVRTLRNRGVIMHIRAKPCLLLRVKQGELWLQWHCEDSTEGLGIPGRPVSDGSWHSVSLEISQGVIVLTLDSYVERRRRHLPAHPWPLGTDGAIFFGAQVLPPDVAQGRGPQALDGFQGCADPLVLNGNEMPLQNKRSRYAQVTGLTELKLGCVLSPDPCQTDPCQNSGRCSSMPTGEFECSCPPQFTGDRCESVVTACDSNPCQNKATCQPMGDSFLCVCQSGFTGPTCQEDTDECEADACENGGMCVNAPGSFYCNCTRWYEGASCSRPVVPEAESLPYMGRDELLGIAALLCVTFLLLTLLITFRRRISSHKPRPQGAATPPRSSSPIPLSPVPIPLHNSDWILSKAVHVGHCEPFDPCGLYLEPEGPPRVMVRPTAHTAPWLRNGSVCGLDSVGPERVESPSVPSDPQSLAVCSVAPSLTLGPAGWPDAVGVLESFWEDEVADTEQNVYQEWNGPKEGEMVQVMDIVEEVTCFSDCSSEVQSLRSFLTDSCNDSASVVTVIQLAKGAVDAAEESKVNCLLGCQNRRCVEFASEYFMNPYHRGASDWVPDSYLPGADDTLGYEVGGVLLTGPDESQWEQESDHYLGKYDTSGDSDPEGEERDLQVWDEYFLRLPPGPSEDPPDESHYDSLPATRSISMPTVPRGDFCYGGWGGREEVCPVWRSWRGLGPGADAESSFLPSLPPAGRSASYSPSCSNTGQRAPWGEQTGTRAGDGEPEPPEASSLDLIK
ncbi:protocadherin Fat 3-like [Arapaima gigas]